MWEQRYRSTADLLYGEAPNAYLVRQAGRLRPGMRALAVADGEGRNGVWLAEQGLEVHSVDGAPTAVERARALARQRGVCIEAECAALEEWTWPKGYFDAVVSIFAHFEPALRERIHGRIRDALIPGGWLILQGFHSRQLGFASGGPRRAEMLFSAALLEEDFAGLQCVELEEYEAILDEGPYHQGRAALVGLVARKPSEAVGHP